MKAELFVDCRNTLGEGPFWNPFVQRLFWFDVPAQTLNSADTSGRVVDKLKLADVTTFGAALDADRILLASAKGIGVLSLSTGQVTHQLDIEADRPQTRSNDGRLHPSGCLWIGTMSVKGGDDPGAGALYRVSDGGVETLLNAVTIPNSTCFSPDGTRGYFTDTVTGIIRTVAVDPQTGRPVGAWSDFADTAGHRGKPDGSVVDAQGYLWNARWGGSCVVRHAPDGSIDRVVELPVSRVTCPAFGGEDLRTLYITTARNGMTDAEAAREPHAGSVFALRVDTPGLLDPTPRV